jgi:YggT family protein
LVDIFVLLGWLIQAYIWLIMFPYAILSWFRIEPGSVWARIQYFLYRATEPVLRPVRQVIRPMGGLDFSFLVVIIVAEILVYRVLWA